MKMKFLKSVRLKDQDANPGEVHEINGFYISDFIKRGIATTFIEEEEIITESITLTDEPKKVEVFEDKVIVMPKRKSKFKK